MNKLSLTRTQILQVWLCSTVVLLLITEFFHLSPLTTYILELLIFSLTVILSVELYRMFLHRYAIFFSFAAFLYNPIFIFSAEAPKWVRPNFFLIFVSVFLCFVLQQHKNTTSKKKDSHVRK